MCQRKTDTRQLVQTLVRQTQRLFTDIQDSLNRQAKTGYTEKQKLLIWSKTVCMERQKRFYMQRQKQVIMVRGIKKLRPKETTDTSRRKVNPKKSPKKPPIDAEFNVYPNLPGLWKILKPMCSMTCRSQGEKIAFCFYEHWENIC